MRRFCAPDGDPDPDTALDILIGLPAAGADLIEIGVPFSDPMADGPLIQHSSQIAIKQNTSVEKRLAVERFTAMEHANIARTLERMGDHATRLALLVRKHSQAIKMNNNEFPLKSIPVWSKQLKTIVHNMYTKDVGIIHSAKLTLAKLGDEIESAEGDLWTGRGSAERLLSEFRISESVRRLCAYSVNFAESLLNMLMYDRLEKVES